MKFSKFLLSLSLALLCFAGSASASDRRFIDASKYLTYDRGDEPDYPQRSGYYKKADEVIDIMQGPVNTTLNKLESCIVRETRSYSCDRAAEVAYCDALSFTLMSVLDDQAVDEKYFFPMREVFDYAGDYFYALDQEGRADLVDFGDLDMSSYKEVAFYCRDFDTAFDPMLAMLRQREYAKLKKEER